MILKKEIARNERGLALQVNPFLVSLDGSITGG